MRSNLSDTAISSKDKGCLYLNIKVEHIRREMSGLHTILRESIGGPWPGESQTTQAHSTIPCGTVRDLCQSFEDRISAHEYERDQIFIDRATRNMDELIRQNRTYAEQLRLAEDATLFNLPAHILGFLRDHDNLYRAAVRSRLAIRSAFASPHIDVLVQVASRLQNIRNVYYINMVEMTRSPSEQRRLMHDPLFNEVFRQCTYSLQDEIICRLTHFDSLLLPSPVQTWSSKTSVQTTSSTTTATISPTQHQQASTTATTLNVAASASKITRQHTPPSSSQNASTQSENPAS